MRKISGRFGGAAGVMGLMGTLVLASSASAQAQTYRMLYSFTEAPDGSEPVAGLVADSVGNLYGTTPYGGAYGQGTVFKVGRTGIETVLYSFMGESDGAEPFGGLVRDSAGNLYGTTRSAGNTSCNPPSGCGTVFNLDTTDNLGVLYSFAGGADGANPFAGLIRDILGNIYGTTENGGGGALCNQGCGTVFKLDATGKETVLHSFAAGKDGANPFSGLVQDSAGTLYGTTAYGGTYGYGTVFKLSATGKEAILHSFTGGADGESPFGGLLPAAASSLAGTTSSGGTLGYGTVFQIGMDGTETTLYSFTGGADGAFPYYGALVRDPPGNLYGTTASGGSFDSGTVFELSANGTETVLHSFGRGRDGSASYATLLRDGAGDLYGTTNAGGAFGLGTVFRLKP